MQEVSVGVGGFTSIDQNNAPPLQATGWTYQFSEDVLQNNMIPAAAYNYDYLNHCSSQGINALGHGAPIRCIHRALFIPARI
jgi:hypothetical protein